jgi:hypothetical protein
MDISPEVSLHESLWSMGDVAIGQAAAEFNGDRVKATRWALAIVNKGWANLMRRTPNGDIERVPCWEIEFSLATPEAWVGFDERTAAIFLRITDQGAQAFIDETNFVEQLDKEYRAMRRPRPPRSPR